MAETIQIDGFRDGADWGQDLFAGFPTPTDLDELKQDPAYQRLLESFTED